MSRFKVFLVDERDAMVSFGAGDFITACNFVIMYIKEGYAPRIYDNEKHNFIAPGVIDAYVSAFKRGSDA